LRGVLSTPDLSRFSNVSNPATVAALANQPTATPNTSACPTPVDDAELPDALPEGVGEIANALIRYLSSGGSPDRIGDVLDNSWQILGENGFVRTDLDLTGEGTPEVVASYAAPNEGGTLLILGCADGRYVLRYESISNEPEPPQVLQFGDINHDQLTDTLFTTPVCDGEDQTCNFQTQLISWKPELGRFVSLLGATIISDTDPQVKDMDGDQVGELVIRLESNGTSESGPLRTGVNIYDWNGAVYVLSIIQLDPPRFRIQVLHEADKEFALGNLDEATSLYLLASESEDLRAWYNDEVPILDAYTTYRLLLTRAAIGDTELFPIYQPLAEAFPDPATEPVYATMARVFWETYQISNDIAEACAQVQAIVAEQPSALNLINRYGDRSPTYTEQDLCPF
jgi:hypothetical protein